MVPWIRFKVLAKFDLCSNSLQKIDEGSFAPMCSQNFCNCLHARILIKMYSISVWRNQESLENKAYTMSVCRYMLLPHFADILVKLMRVKIFL